MEEMMGSGIDRNEPQMDKSEESFITGWQETILNAKKHWSKDFKRMREDMMIARQGASDEWINADNYTVPIINRYLNQSVASLYAKNPKAYAERRKTLDFRVWDGKPETAQSALIAVKEADAMGILPDPEQVAILADIQQGRQRKNMIDKIGKTMEIMFDYFANEQKPKLKPQMKRMVRRAKTCGVAYVMLGFQRKYSELTPDETAKLEDARNKIAELQRRMQDAIDGEIDQSCESEKYELETLIRDLQNKSDVLLREGPLFMFPRSTEVIVDPRCTDLVGFIGAGWIAREFHKSPKEIQKIYKVDIGQKFTSYSKSGSGEQSRYQQVAENEDTGSRNSEKGDKSNGYVCVWEVYNKDLGQTFTIADGYKGFLKPCQEPSYWMEGFWPIFAITFNECESESSIYPLSDVHQLKNVQSEYNRSREYRRLHREANKPKYVAIKGKLTDEDKKLLESHPAHAVIELNSMNIGENIRNIIQRFESVPIDPALYETNSEMEDVLRTVGAQEANIGGMSGGTATESSIAEGGRMTSLASNVDDLDELLSDLVAATGQLMLMEISQETAYEIAGIGAVWPEMNKEQIAKQVFLKVKAGSSGRPNKAADLANMERGMPYLLQLPGINPHPIAARYADLLDIDLEDIVVEGMPSITAINAQAGRVSPMGAGTPNDPNMQGGQGANNNPSAQRNEPGPQPSFQTVSPGAL